MTVYCTTVATYGTTVSTQKQQQLLAARNRSPDQCFAHMGALDALKSDSSTSRIVASTQHQARSQR
ncbi:MAG: hypothetical protein NTU77_01325, partial [Actinobacteria bacterium]|nr:hypothetical protein [Actinomycetota bacterium]